MPAQKKRESDKYAPTSWGASSEDLECPSGQVCLVRRIDPMQLLADGVLSKSDMLTALVDQKHVSKKAKGGRNSAKSQEMSNEMVMKQALKDPKKMQELVDVVNAVTLATVIKPELHPVPEDEEDRIPGNVYIDSVDINDKMFIVQYAFAGHRDAAKFRRELQQSVERLADGEGVPEETE
jgi:hypothetical protein